MLVAGLLVVGFGVPAVAIVRDAAHENELEVWARRMALRVMRLRWPSPTTASAPAAPAVAAAARGVPAATTVGDNNNHSHRSQSALAAPAPVVTHPWEEVYATRRAPVALSVPAPPLPAMAVMTRHTFSSIPMSPAGMAGAPPTTARSAAGVTMPTVVAAGSRAAALVAAPATSTTMGALASASAIPAAATPAVNTSHQAPVRRAYAATSSAARAVSSTAPIIQAAGQNLIVDTANGNSPYAVTSDEAWTNVTAGSTSTGVINHTAGTFSVSNQFLLGSSSGGIGTYNLSGTTTSLSTNGITVGNSGVGTFTQSGGSVTTNGGGLHIGLGSGGSYTLSGAGSSLSTGEIDLGVGAIGASGGFFVQSDGSVTTNGNKLILGNLGALAGGSYSLSGGTLSTGEIDVGWTSSRGTFTQSSGSITTNGNKFIVTGGGIQGNVIGSYSLSGGTLSTGEIDLATNVTPTSTGTITQNGGSITTNGNQLVLNGIGKGLYQFNGGTLTVGSVSSQPIGGFGTGTFNFNGGTLQAGGNSTTFFQGITTANVQTGGAVVDTNGFSVTVAQNLLHDTTAGAPATDGGLTKLGVGTLTLTGENTYTGGTFVSAGTLLVNNTAGSGTGSGNVTVAGSARLGGSGTIAGSVTLGSAEIRAGPAAILAPGNSPGMLTIGGNLIFNTPTLLELEIGGLAAGSQYDQVRIGGTLTLGGSTLSVTLVNGFAFSLGQTFYVLDRTGSDVTPAGMFANAPAGIYTDALGDTFRVNYLASNSADGDGLFNDVSLTVLSVVPEPGTWTLIGAGCLVAVARRRRWLA